MPVLSRLAAEQLSKKKGHFCQRFHYYRTTESLAAQNMLMKLYPFFVSTLLLRKNRYSNIAFCYYSFCQFLCISVSTFLFCYMTRDHSNALIQLEFLYYLNLTSDLLQSFLLLKKQFSLKSKRFTTVITVRHCLPQYTGR